MTQAARNALGRVDYVLAENAEPLKDTIANPKVFSAGLAKNTGGFDGIVAGLELMTGGGAGPAQKVSYDLIAPRDFVAPKKPVKGLITIPEPTAVVMLQTQRMLFSPSGGPPAFADMQWSDSIPKMLQAKLIQGFENYDIDHAPLRSIDGLEAVDQILIDVRTFQIKSDPDLTAEIGFSDRILAMDGHVVASRVFVQSQGSTSSIRRPPRLRSMMGSRARDRTDCLDGCRALARNLVRRGLLMSSD